MFQRVVDLFEPLVPFSVRLIQSQPGNARCSELRGRLEDVLTACQQAWSLDVAVDGNRYWLFGPNRMTNLFNSISDQLVYYIQVIDCQSLL